MKILLRGTAQIPKTYSTCNEKHVTVSINAA